MAWKQYLCAHVVQQSNVVIRNSSRLVEQHVITCIIFFLPIAKHSPINAICDTRLDSSPHAHVICADSWNRKRWSESEHVTSSTSVLAVRSELTKEMLSLDVNWFSTDSKHWVPESYKIRLRLLLCQYNREDKFQTYRDRFRRWKGNSRQLKRNWLLQPLSNLRSKQIKIIELKLSSGN